MARIGQGHTRRRLWLWAALLTAVLVLASFGTPKVGCANSPDDEPDVAASQVDISDLEELNRSPTARRGFNPVALWAIKPETFCPTAGTVTPLGAQGLRVIASGMRGVVAHDASRSVELAFILRGMSKDAVPLANGEMREQIGVKLRAQDTCNVIYVMWHVAPLPGVAVSVKSNPGLATHVECLDRGYINLTSTVVTPAPAVAVNEPHTLRADLNGDLLRVHADGIEVWSATLPKEAFAFDGAAGVRSDNGEFDFELRLPGGGDRTAICTNAGTEHAH